MEVSLTPSQRFPYLFFSRMATFSLSFLRSNEISRLQNVLPHVSWKGLLVRFALSLAKMASEYFKALKQRMETKLNIASDDRIPKAN